MNKKEIYSMIERCVDELQQKDSQEKEENRWTLLEIGKEEYLICDICSRTMHKETTYISISNASKKVLCEKCWKKENEVKSDE